jgi:gliding motility-associated transport system permease protein
MRNVWIIARREYKLFFISPIAYVVAVVFLFLLGYFFYSGLVESIAYSMYYQSPPPGPEIVTGQMMIILLVFSMPAVTMRSIAEEVRMNTMELMLTAPVRDWELIVGKWLGAFLYMLTLLAVTLIFPLILNFMVNPGIDQGMLLTGYIGLILMVASLLAIGIFISSLFSNQVVVFFVSLVVMLIFWFVLRPLGSNTSSTGSQILNYLNIIQHYISFYQGSIDLSDIVYYLSLTSLALFLGTASIEMRRWR